MKRDFRALLRAVALLGTVAGMLCACAENGSYRDDADDVPIRHRVPSK